MRPLVLAGILLMLIGVFAFTYQGITYLTREQVAEVGPIEVTRVRENTLPLPPLVGAVCVVTGIVLLVMGARRPAAPH
jgi:hypothetical protein